MPNTRPKSSKHRASKPNSSVNKTAAKNTRKLSTHKKGPKAQESMADDVVMSVTSMAQLHQRNAHHGRYDFTELVEALPELEGYVINNVRGDASINFSDNESVKMLNKALLALHYGVKHWDIPEGFLCPPIPGRADYVHHIADLLALSNRGDIPTGNKIIGLDIGTGANAIYPIVASACYQWQMVGSDIDPISVENASNIAKSNPALSAKHQFRLQPNSKKFFANIIQPGEFYDFCMCNPPFHKSLAEASKGSERKRSNLALNRVKRGQKAEPEQSSALNFGGQKAELWCVGGEESFIRNMAFESRDFGTQCLWFSTLISKKENVRQLTRALNKVGVEQIKLVEMTHGQKITRFIAWSFLTPEQQKQWSNAKWR